MANLLLVLLAVGGGILVPPDQLPGPMGTMALALPSGALGEALRGALLTGGAALWPTLTLVAWTGVLAGAAARFFRWD